MTQTSSEISLAADQSIASVVRRLAGYLRRPKDETELVEAFDRALPLITGIDGLRIESLEEAGNILFDRLYFPLRAVTKSSVVMHFAPRADIPLTGGDLQLATAVADLVGVVLDQSIEVRRSRGAKELLDLVSAELKWGIIYFGETGETRYVSSAARRLLGDSIPPNLMALEGFLQGETEHEIPPLRPFPQRHLLRATIRQHETGSSVALIADLAPEAAAFGVALDTWVGQSARVGIPATLAMVGGPAGSWEALDVVESLGRELGMVARWGPMNNRWAALIVQELQPSAVWRALRSLKPSGANSLVAGVKEVRGKRADSAQLVIDVTNAMKPFPNFNQPELLVVDRSPAVVESLGFILRSKFNVLGAVNTQTTLDCLGSRVFDGLILELPWEDESAHGFVRRAIAMQPDAAKFFTSEQPGPWPLDELALPAAPVFRKPFIVKEIRSALASSFPVSE